MNNMQHRLVVLGSMDEFVELVKRAKDRGYYTIVCDGYEGGPAKRIADSSHTIDVRDTDAVAAMCRDERADGIISSFSDVLAESLVAVAKEAGLPSYLTPDRLAYLRDKSLMKQMFDALGVPYPRTIKVRPDMTRSDLAELSFPCVIKPVNAYGSHGVSLLDSAENLEGYINEAMVYSTADYALAEEYDSGFEFNMMSWVVDGRPIVLDVADREKTADAPHVTPHVSRIVYPSRLTDVVLDEASSILGKVAAYVGMDNGPLCMQFFWSPQRGVHVCECAGRIFGYEHELLELASGGLSIEDLLLDYVYDRDALRDRLLGHDAHLKGCAAGLYFHGHEGRIARIEGIPSPETDSLCKESIAYYAPGQDIRHGVGDKPYVARCYLLSSSRDEIDKETDAIFAQAKVVDSSGKSLLYRNERMSYDHIGQGRRDG